MKPSKTHTRVRVAIANAAVAEARLIETPASLTLCTPNAAVQVQIEQFQGTDSRPLPKPGAAE